MKISNLTSKHTICALLCCLPLLTNCGADPKKSAPSNQPITEDKNPYAPGPALWKISDEDTTLYLFGTVHLLKAGTDWRSVAFEAAWQETDYVYFETDVSMSAQLGMQKIMTQLGMNPKGTSLSSFFNDVDLAVLKQGAKNAKLPFAMLEPMRPWLAMLVISVQQYITEGANPTSGVDYVLNQEAASSDKEIRFFETPEQQISFFADFSDAEAARMLVEGLVYTQDHPDLFDTMTEDWLAGRPQALADMINDSLTSNPTLTQTLLYDRNKAWVEELATLMVAEQGTFLIAVGAGHLAGTKSVQDYLATKGFVAERQ